MSTSPIAPSHKTVLFLCTGNYYRSRFAEHLFNHLARDAAINWRAESRGLAIEDWINPGPISPHTLERMKQLRFDDQAIHREPEQVTYGDLRRADLIVALKDAEHRPLLDRKFPGWSNQTAFWHVHDVADLAPDRALSQIEKHTRELVLDLKKQS